MSLSTWMFSLLRQEGRQRKEEGVDGGAVDAVVGAVTEQAPLAEIEAAYDALMRLSVSPDFPFDEPSDWETIVSLSPMLGAGQAGVRASEMDGGVLLDRMRGAWFGRCAACALGKPLECGPYMNYREGVSGWQGIRIYLKGAGAWPLDFYVPDAGVIEGYEVRCPDSQREHIRFMETDDDIRYTVLGLHVLEQKGAAFTTVDVAHAWWNVLPIGQTFTAERAAYRNLANTLEQGPLDDGALDYVRTHRNPFREWIGAQIRADGWAYGAAGQAALGAEFGYRDAALSHVKNGIYGEMLFASAIAAAFACEDALAALEQGLQCIPSTSRLAKDVSEAIALGKRAGDLDELHDELWKRWGHYDGVHTNNNAALVAAAIAFGGDDFEKTIVAAVTGGWDTDCNGATAGSLWGAAYGYGRLPEKWIAPLNDTLYAAIPGFHPIAISECARRSVETALGCAEA